tara:strand:+ start:3580 stop:3996 length:417 start_codon:yes stop_codon:yes gene_type:complete
MKTNFLNLSIKILITLLCLLTVSCSKNDDSNNSGEKTYQIKYELTGTFSGTLIIVYDNEDGVNQVEDNVSLPWSKLITIKTDGSLPIGLSANSEIDGFGNANENMTGKIMIGGIVKKSANVNTTSDGFINLGMSTFLQ